MTYKIYADGCFYGYWDGDTPEEAIQKAADEVGTIDVGETQASVDGMTAEPA